MPRTQRIALLVVILLAACGQAREVSHRGDQGACASCHPGASAAAAVGAHATHVEALSGELACAECHPDPRGSSTAAHKNGRVDVVFGGLATRDGALASRYEPSTRSCTAVYCHGAFPGGSGDRPVSWDGGAAEAACGTCHARPPSATHSGLDADPTGCVHCHVATVGGDGEGVTGGTHVNGRLDGGHDVLWMAPASATFHGDVAWQHLPKCRTCHGQDLDGGLAGVACARCHASGGALDCTSCHGVPPPARHAGVSQDPRGCSECHRTTVDAEGALVSGGGHLNGSLDGGHPDAWTVATSAPFHGARAREDVAACRGCHGEALDGGVAGVACSGCHAPGGALACTSCHGVPPPATHAGVPADPGRCVACHPGAISTDGPLAGGTHLDGRVEGGHPDPWSVATGAEFHGAWAWGALSSCRVCHGPALEGGTAGVACATCHATPGSLRCESCHGVPPPATHAGVPADQGRCVACHASTVGADGALLVGGSHLDGRVEGAHADPWTLSTGADSHGSWAWRTMAACRACHGAALDGGAAQVSCASCHGAGLAACTRCHRASPGAPAIRSSHFARSPAPDENCRGCHASGEQADGHDRLPAGDWLPDAACVSCHAGQGQMLGPQTPPLLVGWTNATSGDFHGAREGAGFGGALAAPYARRQPPLPCRACHEEHSSANAFLFADTVNGKAIPAGSIDRAGVGAQALCSACHQGAPHASCLAADCHGSDPAPASSACFRCHGHEGILNFYPYQDCDHCHAQGSLSLPPEYAAPVLSAVSVSGITATTATVRWQTDENATSYVEYGSLAPGHVAGTYARSYRHEVALTGLTPETTYVWRVRSSDVSQNTAVSALQPAFTTPAVDAVPRPDPAPSAAVSVWSPATTTTARLLWYPVAAPSGTTVEYEVQLAADPAFTVIANAELARADETLATGNTGWIPGIPAQDQGYPRRSALAFDVTLTNLPQDDCWSAVPAQYYFRVRARDQTGKVSEWSTTGSFGTMAWSWCE